MGIYINELIQRKQHYFCTNLIISTFGFSAFRESLLTVTYLQIAFVSISNLVCKSSGVVALTNKQLSSTNNKD